MRDDFVYIHLEPIANLIYSRGLSVEDFLRGIPRIPTHILLLNTPINDNLSVEPHTQLNTISGTFNIRKYLTNPKAEHVSWLDYSHAEGLEELLPEEIAELLFLGHMHTHYTTPFSYKLQNEFVFLSLGSKHLKVYYRKLKNFYPVLNDSLIRHTRLAFNERRMFRRYDNFAEIPQSMLRQLTPILSNGIIFAFDQAFEQEKQYRIPILVVADNGQSPIYRSRTSLYNKAKQVAVLRYNMTSGHWHLVITDSHAFEDDQFY
ncbi:Hypothetical protein ADU72_1488 [Pediococcus damnosus]|uniref:Uncharacterized protein n=1 Tax=Pediococcus damnosus TaxID=51663 RepID=A0A0R2HSR2_9LACO|nr:hypothetical protein [Pediococcus damnosus]AMV62700.1 Hypothetical protein ADU70_1208 [Pediococcus damnosus]AMV67415.1 Hypothetical protein ADU72_1488 [Pediococcus damnosus]AMV69713.1 Hypothetical protein ADU73_1317 [Pediococcus damnosus]KJU74209.1 hypothetical protein AH70_07925 [Pediococcus damnosus LMG 28219]KRN53573.1 hypothetical protein IV84_GL000089 [Pediococcus damnosus]